MLGSLQHDNVSGFLIRFPWDDGLQSVWYVVGGVGGGLFVTIC